MFEYLSIKLSSDTVFSMRQSDESIKEANRGHFGFRTFDSFESFFTIRAFFEIKFIER